MLCSYWRPFLRNDLKAVEFSYRRKLHKHKVFLCILKPFWTLMLRESNSQRRSHIDSPFSCKIEKTRWVEMNGLSFSYYLRSMMEAETACSAECSHHREGNLIPYGTNITICTMDQTVNALARLQNLNVSG